MSTYDYLLNNKTTAASPKQTIFTREVAPEPTRSRVVSRDYAREPSRAHQHEQVSVLPTRQEIQHFSFELRDELKVKVQAEVPHHWQTELEELARQLDVKKLELYRFIIGEFLGKIEREVRKPHAP